MSGKNNKQQSSGFDSSWIPVFLCLWFIWPVGLILLYNKLKKANGANNKRKGKPVSMASAGLFAMGGAMMLGGGAKWLGPFALLGGAAVFVYSQKMRADERKFTKYSNVIGPRPLASISAIAAAMPVSFEQAQKDLQKMIDEGYFGKRAYIDHSTGMFIADSHEALSHLSTMQRKYEEVKPEKLANPVKDKLLKPEDEYQQKLNQIRKLDDDITDEGISEKIRRIEAVTANIFELVKQKPAKKPEIQTFMNYYLPTTLKLLDSYSVLERQSIGGDNINSSKANIEKMIDQLVFAFERQLDQMFEADARDISSDITVLERMMARDGLTENPYSLPKSLTGELPGIPATGAAQSQQQQQQ